MFSYPLESFVCREVLMNTLFRDKKDDNRIHVLVTFLIVFLTVLLSYFTDCLGVTLEINVYL